MVWREIIVKKLLTHIDGVPKVDSVIPEVEQTDPLLKGKGRERNHLTDESLLHRQSVLVRPPGNYQD